MASHSGQIFVVTILFIIIVSVLVYFSIIKFDLNKIFIWFAISLLFNYIPEIDANSGISLFIYYLFFIGIIVLIYYKKYTYSSYLGLLIAIPVIGAHPSWNHKWFSAILLPLPIIILTYFYYNGFKPQLFLPLYIAAVLGYLTHLIVDKISK